MLHCFALIGLAASHVPAATTGTAPVTQSAPATQPAPAGACHALLVGGLPGTPVHARQYRDWIKRFHAYLVNTAKVPAANVVVLSGDKDFKDPIVRGLATAESVRQAIAEVAKTAAPQDQFVLVMVGLGVGSEKVPLFVLPGPDISAEELKESLAAVGAGNQVVLNFTSAAGDCVKFLARKGRVVVSANMPGQDVPPVYAEFFLRGLESSRADGEAAPEGGAKDGTVTVLEAYNWSAYQTALWIARQRKTGENVWRVDGRESVEIFRKLYVTAGDEPGSRKLSPDSDAGKDDAVVPLKIKGKEDTAAAKMGRRVVTEHAGLEDCGEEAPVSALGDEEKDYAPLSGFKKGEPGNLARRVLLGRAQLLPPER
jgi:hypothetical protein